MSFDHQAVRERPVVVRAVRADREDFVAAADQQDLLVADMANEHSAIRKFGEGNALLQIGADRVRLVLGHSLLRDADGTTPMARRGRRRGRRCGR